MDDGHKARIQTRSHEGPASPGRHVVARGRVGHPEIEKVPRLGQGEAELLGLEDELDASDRVSAV